MRHNANAKGWGKVRGKHPTLVTKPLEPLTQITSNQCSALRKSNQLIDTTAAVILKMLGYKMNTLHEGIG